MNFINQGYHIRNLSSQNASNVFTSKFNKDGSAQLAIGPKGKSDVENITDICK